MAGVSTAVKRAFVRYLLRLAVTNSATLLATIEAASDARVVNTGSGKVLTSNSGNGHTVSFSFPTDFNPTYSLELLSEIQDRYEEAKDALIAAGTAAPTDSQIGVEILDKLRPVRSVAHDYSGLRYDLEVVE